MEMNLLNNVYLLDISYPLNYIYLILKILLKSNICDNIVIYLCKCFIILSFLQIFVISDGDPCIYAVHRCRDLQKIYTPLKISCDICYNICYNLYFCIFFLRFSFRCSDLVIITKILTL